MSVNSGARENSIAGAAIEDVVEKEETVLLTEAVWNKEQQRYTVESGSHALAHSRRKNRRDNSQNLEASATVC